MTAETPIMDQARLEHKRATYAHVGDVGVEISVELGHKSIPLSQARCLRKDEVIELDKLAGEAFEMRANGHPFALGEIAVVADLMAFRITQFIQQARG